MALTDTPWRSVAHANGHTIFWASLGSLQGAVELFMYGANVVKSNDDL